MLVKDVAAASFARATLASHYDSNSSSWGFGWITKSLSFKFI